MLKKYNIKINYVVAVPSLFTNPYGNSKKENLKINWQLKMENDENVSEIGEYIINKITNCGIITLFLN